MQRDQRRGTRRVHRHRRALEPKRTPQPGPSPHSPRCPVQAVPLHALVPADAARGSPAPRRRSRRNTPVRAAMQRPWIDTRKLRRPPTLPSSSSRRRGTISSAPRAASMPKKRRIRTHPVSRMKPTISSRSWCPGWFGFRLMQSLPDLPTDGPSGNGEIPSTPAANELLDRPPAQRKCRRVASYADDRDWLEIPNPSSSASVGRNLRPSVVTFFRVCRACRSGAACQSVQLGRSCDHVNPPVDPRPRNQFSSRR